MTKKETRGGYREGAGRKKGDIETTTIAFRVPVNKAEKLKVAIKKLMQRILMLRVGSFSFVFYFTRIFVRTAPKTGTNCGVTF